MNGRVVSSQGQDNARDATFSSPLVGQDLRRSRTSFLRAASDTVFGRTRTTTRSATTQERPSTAIREEQLPIVDIFRRNSTEENEEIERGRLRDAAARSIGIAMYPSSHHVPYEVEEDEADGDRDRYSVTPTPTSPAHLTPNANGASRANGRPGTADHRRIPSGDHSGNLSNGDILSAVPRNLATVQSTRSTRSARSSVRSVGSSVRHRDKSSTLATSPIPPSRREALAPFPCLLSSLNPHIQTSCSLTKFVSSGSSIVSLITSKVSQRNWKLRHLVLTSVELSSGSGAMGSYTHSHLHVFKNNSPQDKELERIEITESSSAFIPEDDPAIAGRRSVLKIIGTNVQRSGKSTGSPGESAWIFQCPDGLVLQHWIASIKNAILIQRYVHP